MASGKLNYVSSIDTGAPTLVQRSSFDNYVSYFRGKKVLDVGCWTGGFEHYLQTATDQAYAIELEPAALKIAQKRYPKVKFQRGTVFSIPYPDSTFDVVTLWWVMEHLPIDSEIRAFKEIRRVLKSRGHFILSVPHWHWFNNILDPAFWLKGHRHYQARHVTQMLKSAGLEAKQIRIQGRFWYCFSVDVFYFWKHILRRPMPARWQNWFDRRIEKELRRVGYGDLYILSQKDE